MKNYLNKSGLTYLIQKIKGLIQPISSKVSTLENNQILYGTCTEEEFQTAMTKSS